MLFFLKHTKHTRTHTHSRKRLHSATIQYNTIHGVFAFSYSFCFSFICVVVAVVVLFCASFDDAFARASFLTTATKLPETSVRRGKWKENEPQSRHIQFSFESFRYFASSCTNSTSTPSHLSLTFVRSATTIFSEALFVCVLLLLFLFWRHENAERTKHNERESERARELPKTRFGLWADQLAKYKYLRFLFE